MIKYKRLCLIFLFMPPWVLADQMSSTFLTCYKENQNGMQVTACLDNAHRNSGIELSGAEKKLLTIFSKLDKINPKSTSVDALNLAIKDFKKWREAQCKMVAATFQSENSKKQSYLSCLIDLNEEQTARLLTLVDTSN